MKIKLCNVHKLAVANEGEGTKPIHIPFGTWEYDSNITQTFDREHAKNIADVLAKHIALGEPGIPVYQGHPDVPEYAGKYPDKGALGWVKKMVVNEDGVDCEVEWDRDPGKGFAWFSPYWVGDDPSVGPDGKRNVIIDGINSIGLVNNPNIHEFRLANEAQPEERKTMKPYQLPQHIIDLANEYDESKHPRAEDGKWTSTGGGSMPKNVNVPDANVFKHSLSKIESRSGKADKINGILRNERKNMKEAGTEFRQGSISGREHREQRRDLRAVHVAAIMSGLSYNRATHQYE